MERLPRKKENRLFNLKSLARSWYIGTFIGIIALFWCLYAWSQTGWSIGQSSIPDHAAYLKGTTMVIVGIMAGQLGMLIATRTNIKSTFSVNLRHNKWLLFAILVELMILFAVVYIPFINPIFNTIALQPFEWLLLYSIVPIVIFFEEGRKFLLRKYFLAPTAISVHRVTTSISGELELPVEKKAPLPIQFVERNSPIILSLTSQSGEENIAALSMNIARNNGSRLIVLRILNEKLKTSLDYTMDRSLRDTAEELGIPYQYVDVRVPQTIESSVQDTIEKTHAETLIVSVPRNVFFGGWHTARFVEWLGRFPNKKIILISSPSKPLESLHPPFRILIPVLHEFNEEPFHVTTLLTAHSAIPDVDIIAAKVMEFPPTVQLYSRYYPETMTVKSNEFSILRRSPLQALKRSITPLTLYVQDISRGIAHFVNERKIDVIIMNGTWSEKGHGFLKTAERKIVKKARCSIIITLTKRN